MRKHKVSQHRLCVLSLNTLPFSILAQCQLHILESSCWEMNKALIYILSTTIPPTCLPGQGCVVAKVSRVVVVVSSLLQKVVARVFWMIVGWMLASQNSPPTSLWTSGLWIWVRSQCTSRFIYFIAQKSLRNILGSVQSKAYQQYLWKCWLVQKVRIWVTKKWTGPMFNIHHTLQTINK